MRSWRWIMAAVGVGMLAAGACSSSSDDDSTPTGSTQTGSTQTGTTPTGTTQTGTTQTGTTQTGTAVCEVGDCDSCVKSVCASDVCAEQTHTCLANADCVDLEMCWSNCTDEACRAACDQQHPEGLEDHAALVECRVCDACYADCDGPSLCG